MRSVLAFLVAIGVASSAVVKFDFHRHHSAAAAQRRAARLNLFFEATQPGGANRTYPQQVNDFGDIIYVGNVSIGNPPQNFTVDFDTGSPDFFVPHGQCGYFKNCGGACHQKNVTTDRCQEEFHCPADICSGKPYTLPPGSCAGLRGFDATKSSTYKKDGQAWYIDYGVGSASGFTAYETVRLGDAQSLLVNNYNFGLATCLDNGFSQGPNDGMFGLSPGRTDMAGEKKTVLEVAYDQGHLDEPVFTAWLEEKGAADNVRAGVYTFGGVDLEHCGPVIDYRRVTINNETQAYDWWKFDLEGVSLGDYKADGKLYVDQG
ncbi:aspartic protease [Aphelenchoides avenae]|nr:aspartic protease [Aphelenchus avenae]